MATIMTMTTMMKRLIICRRLIAFFAAVLVLPYFSAAAVGVSASLSQPILEGTSRMVNDDAAVNVPTFSLADLLTGRRLHDLKAVLTTTGLLAVVGDGSSGDGMTDGGTDDFDDNVAWTALQGLCRCTSDNKKSFLSMQGTDTITLNDDSAENDDNDGSLFFIKTTITTRTTLATATVGTTPLPLPDSLATRCGLDTAHAMETLRDQVAVVSNAFIQALDLLLVDESSRQHQQQRHRPLLSNIDGGSYSSMASIRNGANHLEHFHVYNKQVNDNDSNNKEGQQQPHYEARSSNNISNKNTLDWHTDAGLFLAFVPAINCHDENDEANNKSSADHSFWVRDAMTQTSVQAIFPTSSIAIMLGAGAQHWLDTTSSHHVLPLQATQHAVKMQSGDARAWYGMMHLVPDRAIVQSSPRRTFADMKKAMTLSASGSSTVRKFGDAVSSDNDKLLQQDGVSIGCGFASEGPDQIPGPSVHGAVASTSRRRRLQHVQSPGECNNVTNFFCWMQCLEIPNPEQARGYVTEGYSLYCLDPATLASTGNRVSSASAPCEQGWVHNANCQGSWQPTAPGVIAYPVNVQVDEVQERFCYGGTSMYMDGFHWLHPTCVIYLFPEWVLSTPAKLASATIGTLGSGIALEKIIQQRRLFVSSMGPGYKRLGVSSLFYAIQLALGYLIMLVVMTYSGPLFMAVVLGLVGGHVLFNASDAFFPGVKAKAGAPSRRSTRETGEKMDDDDSGEESPKDDEAEDAEKTANCSKIENNSGLPDDSCCEKGSTGSDTKTQEVHVPVPEGITPCCLNTL